jgi:hypothetical protein
MGAQNRGGIGVRITSGCPRLGDRTDTLCPAIVTQPLVVWQPQRPDQRRVLRDLALAPLAGLRRLNLFDPAQRLEVDEPQ